MEAMKRPAIANSGVVRKSDPKAAKFVCGRDRMCRTIPCSKRDRFRQAALDVVLKVRITVRQCYTCFVEEKLFSSYRAQI